MALLWEPLPSLALVLEPLAPHFSRLNFLKVTHSAIINGGSQWSGVGWLLAAISGLDLLMSFVRNRRGSIPQGSLPMSHAIVLYTRRIGQKVEHYLSHPLARAAVLLLEVVFTRHSTGYHPSHADA